MKRPMALIAFVAATAFCSVGANAANHTGAMVFQSVEKYAKDISDKSKRDIDAGTAMTMGYILGVADSDRAVCPDPRASVAHYMIAVHALMGSDSTYTTVQGNGGRSPISCLAVVSSISSLNRSLPNALGNRAPSPFPS